ncbi:hypothetical protein OSB04_026117 [Centaurea solstitialis]|uniref:RRM domain-containing protein n=1 Tax=Centaurea solstitialis TaxID=347529 RepID=A0AA38SPI3_9ASTR|nr:hypothetical protein OSB04_026117 [Centaurea solstitialis]
MRERESRERVIGRRVWDWGVGERVRTGHRLGSREYSSFYKDLDFKRGSNRKEISFMFFNFPETIEVSELWRIFKRIGDVSDIYMARRRLKNGKKFGFIRFRSENDTWSLEKKLANVWIGSFKLVIYRATAKSGDARLGMKNHNHNQDDCIRKDKMLAKGERKNTKTYKEAVCEGKHSAKTKSEDQNFRRDSESDFQEISLGSWEEDPLNSSFLKLCLVGSIASSDNFDAVAKLISNIWEGCSIKILGGKQVLIYLANEENIRSVLDNPKHGIHYWVKNLSRWSVGYRQIERFTWIKVTGVPLHGWKEEIFSSIAGKWGQVLRLRNCNLLEEDVLNEGRILICTPIRTPIQEIGNIKIGQLFYRVVVSEVEDGFTMSYSRKSENVSSDEGDPWCNSENDSKWSSDPEDNHDSNHDGNKEFLGKEFVDANHRKEKDVVGVFQAMPQVGDRSEKRDLVDTDTINDGAGSKANDGVADLANERSEDLREKEVPHATLLNPVHDPDINSNGPFAARPNSVGHDGKVGPVSNLNGVGTSKFSPNLKEDGLEDRSPPVDNSACSVNNNGGYQQSFQENNQTDESKDPQKSMEAGSKDETVGRKKSTSQNQNQKQKPRKSEALGIGRGKVSFHLMKKCARSKNRKANSHRGREGGSNSVDRSPVRFCKSKGKEATVSQNSISNELGGKASEDEIREFGGMLGVVWKDQQIAKEGADVPQQ